MRRRKKGVSIDKIIKKLDEVYFVAQLIVDLAKTNGEQFILLKGNIGSGKTTLVKEIAKILNEKSPVISPTFNKMFVYENFVHIDAYNLEGESLESYQDFFEDKIVIIEWAEKLSDVFKEGFEIEISFVDENSREYKITWKE